MEKKIITLIDTYSKKATKILGCLFFAWLFIQIILNAQTMEDKNKITLDELKEKLMIKKKFIMFNKNKKRSFLNQLKIAEKI